MQNYSFQQGLWSVPPKRDMTRSLLLIPAEQIVPNPNQPRRTFDEEKLKELMISIAQVGLIQPLTVRQAAGGYELISGERRLRACRLLGMKEIPCVIENVGEEKSALMALIENIQRADLNYVEEAQSYQALLISQGLSQETLSRRLGKSQSFLSNKLRLLKLSPALREKCLEAGLSERHARCLLALPEEEQRLACLEQIQKRNLTVRETEAYIAARLQEEQPRPLRILRLSKDTRLFLNGLKASLEQLREAGMETSLEEQRDGGTLTLTVRIHTE